jgi:hypothetical protein
MKGTIVSVLDDNPIYRVSMEAAPVRWDAAAWQFIIYKNPSYLNSLWLGTVVNFLNIPSRIFNEAVFSFIGGRTLWALAMLIQLPFSVLIHLIAGLLGRLHSIDAPLTTIVRARLATDAEIAQDMAYGFEEHVKEIGRVEG